MKHLMKWFNDHCDEDWEHDFGIKIVTLDNPGWALDVRIEDTELEGVVTDWHIEDADGSSWLYWRATGVKFEARCGPEDLESALESFRIFSSRNDK